jgi:molybdate transport repressor ModE-like protein
MPKDLSVRFRVDFGPQCSIGIGKIELLEGIARCGSLSQAAREMRMSYRRAWLLLADLNSSFDQPVARLSTGGRGGGGAELTSFGKRVVAGYRRLESALHPLANTCLNEVSRRVSVQRSAALIHPASVRRKKRANESR